MFKISFKFLFLLTTLFSVFSGVNAQQFSSDNGNGTFNNPVIYADVPDLCVIRVDSAFYMVSTTMHLTPGIPVMRSYDLVNWEIINYCYPELETTDAFSLKNGLNDYAAGSWASNIRYDEKLKRFFVITASQTTNKSYIFSTADIENGPWHRNVIDKCYDPGLLLNAGPNKDENYVFFGQQNHHYRRVYVDPVTFDVTLGPDKLWKENCSYNQDKGVWVEGAQSIKIGDYYYLFMIELRGSRVQNVWRGTDVNDSTTWQARRAFLGNIKDVNGKDVMSSSGIAQGAIVDTKDGKWYALLFQDYGAVGRIPVLIPVEWTADGWPVLGNNGTSVSQVLQLPVSGNPRLSLLKSDEFNNGTTRRIISESEVGTGVVAGITVDNLANIVKGTSSQIKTAIESNEFAYNGSNMGLNWQWNHNRNNNLWSLVDRPGYYRLKSGIIAANIRTARNTLTQRTYGPVCSGNVALETAHMKDGDVAGLAAFQNRYGFVGVKMNNGVKKLIMHKALANGDATGAVIDSVTLTQDRVYLRVDFDFRDTPLRQHTDKAYFYYSLDSINWVNIGEKLQMYYDWPDFMGYRFGLFYYSTKNLGGYVDFDYFHVDSTILTALPKIDAFKKNEAEDVTTYSGITTEGASDGTQNICDTQNNEWVSYKNVDFGSAGALSFSAQVASASSGGKLEIRLGSTTGTLIGTVTVANTGGWQSWVTQNIPVTQTTGVQDVYFVFKGTGTLFNLNWWKFRTTGYSTDLLLKHSYTFTDGTANDVVGSANGTLVGGKIANGAYTTSANGQYITLPAGTIGINAYNAITLEAYVKAGVNAGWTMFSYFGGANGANAYWVSLARLDDVSRTGFNASTNTEIGTSGAEPAAGETHHYVSVLSEDALRFYIDGVLVSTASVPVSSLISNISAANAWLGKGGYADPTYIGTTYEFNIYSGIMNPAQVLTRYNYFKTQTGIKDIVDNNLIRIYPTATNGTFNVDTTENVTVKVCDISGKLILQKDIAATRDELTLPVSGVYVVEAKSKNHICQRKIIKL